MKPDRLDADNWIICKTHGIAYLKNEGCPDCNRIIAARAQKALDLIVEELANKENQTLSLFEKGYLSALRYILGDEALRAAAHPEEDIDALTLLKCPFCSATVTNIDFKPHISQSHPDEGPQKGYIRWMENLRLDAGGKLYSGGSG